MKLRVLSLGAGIQSTALALMAAHGELERPDCAIFADTQSEPAHVYEHLKWLRSEGVLPYPVHVITVGSLKEDLSRTSGARSRIVAIPYFLDNGTADEGIGRRQCTREYKVDPLTLKERELLGYLPRQHIPPGSAEIWMGISTDEAHRMKPARYPWQINRYPLIDRRMSRGDCMLWLERHGYPVPGKSACTFCPYRSDSSWLEMKRNDPVSWAEAVEVDEGLRRNQRALRLEATPYIHRSLRPLAEVDLSENQLDLFGNDCEGYCGI